MSIYTFPENKYIAENKQKVYDLCFSVSGDTREATGENTGTA